MSCERYDVIIAPSAKADYDKYKTARAIRAVSGLYLNPEDDVKKSRFPYKARNKAAPDAVGDPMEPGHVMIVIEGKHAIRIAYRIDRERCLVTIAAVDPTPYLL